MNKPEIHPLLSKESCTMNAKKPPKRPRLQVRVLALRVLQPSALPCQREGLLMSLCGDSERGMAAHLLQE